MNDNDRIKAEFELLHTLNEGEESAREKGWLSADDVEVQLGLEE